jgi:hypothetical protein
MPRCSCSFRTTGAGSTTLPIASIFAPASGVTPRLAEVHVSNTTVTAVCLTLRLLSALGTAGTGQTEICEDDRAYVPLATVFDTHTVAPTFVTGNYRALDLGAAIGSAVMWTFGPKGLAIPVGTANGIGVVPLTGAGQICTVTFVWDE